MLALSVGASCGPGLNCPAPRDTPWAEPAAPCQEITQLKSPIGSTVCSCLQFPISPRRALVSVPHFSKDFFRDRLFPLLRKELSVLGLASCPLKG